LFVIVYIVFILLALLHTYYTYCYGLLLYSCSLSWMIDHKLFSIIHPIANYIFELFNPAGCFLFLSCHTIAYIIYLLISYISLYIISCTLWNVFRIIWVCSGFASSNSLLINRDTFSDFFSSLYISFVY
jgi:hypothetical protein